MATARPLVAETARYGGEWDWIVAIAVMVFLAIGVVFFGRAPGPGTVEGNAVANTAHEVGDAAQKAGKAAQRAANGTAN